MHLPITFSVTRHIKHLYRVLPGLFQPSIDATAVQPTKCITGEYRHFIYSPYPLAYGASKVKFCRLDRLFTSSSSSVVRCACLGADSSCSVAVQSCSALTHCLLRKPQQLDIPRPCTRRLIQRTPELYSNNQ